MSKNVGEISTESCQQFNLNILIIFVQQKYDTNVRRKCRDAQHTVPFSFSRCLQLTQKKWFDYTVLIFIGINCITLAMERPSIPPKSLERQFLTFTGYVFTVIFTIEMSMKVSMI